MTPLEARIKTRENHSKTVYDKIGTAKNLNLTQTRVEASWLDKRAILKLEKENYKLTLHKMALKGLRDYYIISW